MSCLRPGAVAFTLILALGAAGCHRPTAGFGGGDAPDVGGGDAPELGGGDAPELGGGDTPDLGGGDAPDMATSAPPDMAAPPPPPPLPSDFRRYGGTTSDGWSVVSDVAGNAWAVKLSDGTTRYIGDHEQAMSTTLDASFVIHGGQSPAGKLELWRKDGPPVHLVDDALVVSAVTAPPLSDGAGHITYIRFRPEVGGFVGALWLDTVDHAAPRLLYGAVDADSPCAPKSRFFAGRLLVYHCDYPSTSKWVLSSYDLAGTADVDLATDAAAWDATAGVGVLVASASGALDIVAADGSGPLTQTPLVTDARSARFTADGSAVIVLTKKGAIERVDVKTHAVTVLQASGALRLYSVSSDGNWATYMHTYDADNDLWDIWMTDARNAGTTPLELHAPSKMFYTTFTDDSAFALYLADGDKALWTGSLHASAVAGAADRTLAVADIMVPAGKSRIVYTDNVTGVDPDILADLSVVDLAGGAPTKLATQAHHKFDVLADGTLVYVKPGEGLKTVRLP